MLFQTAPPVYMPRSSLYHAIPDCTLVTEVLFACSWKHKRVRQFVEGSSPSQPLQFLTRPVHCTPYGNTDCSPSLLLLQRSGTTMVFRN
jgi:hypothetical protein